MLQRLVSDFSQPTEGEREIQLVRGQDIVESLDERMFWLSEAAASRRPEEARLARERACANGATAVSADMVAYEWLYRCDTATFKDVHRRFLKPRAAQKVRLF